MKTKHLFIYLTLLLSTSLSLMACGDKPKPPEDPANTGGGDGGAGGASYNYCDQTPKPARCTSATVTADTFGRAAITTSLRMKGESPVQKGAVRLQNNMGNRLATFTISTTDAQGQKSDKTINELLSSYVPATFSLVMEFPEWKSDTPPTGKTPLFVWLGEEYNDTSKEVQVNNASTVEGGSASAIALESLISNSKLKTAAGKLNVPIKLGGLSLKMTLEKAQIIADSITSEGEGVKISGGLIAGTVKKSQVEDAIIEAANTCNSECIEVNKAAKTCNTKDATKCSKEPCKKGLASMCAENGTLKNAALFGMFGAQDESASVVLSFDTSPVKITGLKESTL